MFNDYKIYSKMDKNTPTQDNTVQLFNISKSKCEDIIDEYYIPRMWKRKNCGL